MIFLLLTADCWWLSMVTFQCSAVLVTSHTEVITSGHPSHRSDYLLSSPTHQYLPLGISYTVVITSVHLTELHRLILVTLQCGWTAAAVAQWVRALAPQAEGLVIESQPRRTSVVQTGSDSSTAKRSAISVSATFPQIIKNGCPVIH